MPAPRKADIEQVVAPRAAGHGVRGERAARREQPLEGRRAGQGTLERQERGRLAPRPKRHVGLRRRARRGEKVVMRSFPAGLYLDVDEEVVAFVRKAKSPLVLGTGEPPPFRVSISCVQRCRRMALRPRVPREYKAHQHEVIGCGLIVDGGEEITIEALHL